VEKIKKCFDSHNFNEAIDLGSKLWFKLIILDDLIYKSTKIIVLQIMVESKMRMCDNDDNTQRWLNHLEMLNENDFTTRWLRIFFAIRLNWKTIEMKKMLREVYSIFIMNLSKGIWKK
jgi:hypothetical protein